MHSSAIMVQRETFALGAKSSDYCLETMCFVIFEGDSIQHTSNIYINFVYLLSFLKQLCKPPNDNIKCNLPHGLIVTNTDRRCVSTCDVGSYKLSTRINGSHVFSRNVLFLSLKRDLLTLKECKQLL